MNHYIRQPSCCVSALVLAASGTLILTCLQACSTTAGTVALTTAGVAGGAVVGAQVANYSKVEATVDVFVPSKEDSHRFQLSRETALKRYVATAVLSKGGYSSIAAQLAGPMNSLQDRMHAIVVLNDQLKTLYGVTPNSDLNETIQGLDVMISRMRTSLQLWSDFKTEVTAGQDSLSMETKLKALREALSDPLIMPDIYLNVVGAAVQRGIFEAIDAADAEPETPLAKAWNEGRKAVESKIQQAIKSQQPGNTASNRIASVLSAALEGLHEMSGPQPSTDAFQLAKGRLSTDVEVWTNAPVYLHKDAGVIVTARVMFEAYKETDQTLRAAFIERQTGDLSAVANAEPTRKAALRVTYSAVLSDANLGPIVNEVAQSVLTPEALSLVTMAGNDLNWQRFSEAKSVGRTGNHDVVIYFENLATPILKSSTFDPTKFVVANGQMFQRAFSVMADIYGLPTGAYSGTSADVNLIHLKTKSDELRSERDALHETLIASLHQLLAVNDFDSDEKVQDAISEAAAKLSTESNPATEDAEDAEASN